MSAGHLGGTESFLLSEEPLSLPFKPSLNQLCTPILIPTTVTAASAHFCTFNHAMTAQSTSADHALNILPQMPALLAILGFIFSIASLVYSGRYSKFFSAFSRSSRSSSSRRQLVTECEKYKEAVCASSESPTPTCPNSKTPLSSRILDRRKLDTRIKSTTEKGKNSASDVAAQGSTEAILKSSQENTPTRPVTPTFCPSEEKKATTLTSPKDVAISSGNTTKDEKQYVPARPAKSTARNSRTRSPTPKGINRLKESTRIIKNEEALPKTDRPRDEANTSSSAAYKDKSISPSITGRDSVRSIPASGTSSRVRGRSNSIVNKASPAGIRNTKTATKNSRPRRQSLTPPIPKVNPSPPTTTTDTINIRLVDNAKKKQQQQASEVIEGKGKPTNTAFITEIVKKVQPKQERKRGSSGLETPERPSSGEIVEGNGNSNAESVQSTSPPRSSPMLSKASFLEALKEGTTVAKANKNSARLGKGKTSSGKMNQGSFGPNKTDFANRADWQTPFSSLFSIDLNKTVFRGTRGVQAARQVVSHVEAPFDINALASGRSSELSGVNVSLPCPSWDRPSSRRGNEDMTEERSMEGHSSETENFITEIPPKAIGDHTLAAFWNRIQGGSHMSYPGGEVSHRSSPDYSSYGAAINRYPSPSLLSYAGPDRHRSPPQASPHLVCPQRHSIAFPNDADGLPGYVQDPSPRPSGLPSWLNGISTVGSAVGELLPVGALESGSSTVTSSSSRPSMDYSDTLSHRLYDSMGRTNADGAHFNDACLTEHWEAVQESPEDVRSVEKLNDNWKNRTDLKRRTSHPSRRGPRDNVRVLQRGMEATSRSHSFDEGIANPDMKPEASRRQSGKFQVLSKGRNGARAL